jgi:hypothetical protein
MGEFDLIEELIIGFCGARENSKGKYGMIKELRIVKVDIYVTPTWSIMVLL